MGLHRFIGCWRAHLNSSCLFGAQCQQANYDARDSMLSAALAEGWDRFEAVWFARDFQIPDVPISQLGDSELGQQEARLLKVRNDAMAKTMSVSSEGRERELVLIRKLCERRIAEIKEEREGRVL